MFRGMIARALAPRRMIARGIAPRRGIAGAGLLAGLLLAAGPAAAQAEQQALVDATVVMLVMTDAGLQALMNSQFKLGADAALTFATIGAGIQGGTTSAVGADIVVLARSRGLFAGMSLQGSILSYLPDYARAYYGRDASARQIVVGMEAHNPGSDPLRAMLMRFGSPQ